MRKGPELLEHEYDGIREYDNPTPGWWHAIFLLSTIFAFFYVLFYQTSPIAPNMFTQHDAMRTKFFMLKFADIGELAGDEPTLLEMMHSEDWQMIAASIFQGNCKSCHGSNGQGLVGPNLTDEYWKNVKSLPDIYKVVSEGAAKGAMPSWQNRLHNNEIVLVSAYVAALRGKNAPGKGPEGEQIAPWPDYTPPPPESE